nr:hypothetical protein GCM10025699_77710 [Microbacterium flavescens]
MAEGASGFRLAGDFFLEPDTALDAIDRAVNGLPVESDAATIAATIKRGLPDDAVLLGFSPEAIAVAIRHAVSRRRPTGATTTGRSSTTAPSRRTCISRSTRC